MDDLVEQALVAEEELFDSTSEENSSLSSDSEDELQMDHDEGCDASSLLEEPLRSFIKKLEIKLKNGEVVSLNETAQLIIFHHKDMVLKFKQLHEQVEIMLRKFDRELMPHVEERNYQNNFPLNAGTIVKFDLLLADVTKGKQFVAFVENALRKHMRKLPESTIYHTMETIVDESVFYIYDWKETEDNGKTQFASTNIANHLKTAIQNVLYPNMSELVRENCARVVLNQWFRRRSHTCLRQRKNATP